MIRSYALMRWPPWYRRGIQFTVCVLWLFGYTVSAFPQSAPDVQIPDVRAVEELPKEEEDGEKSSPPDDSIGSAEGQDQDGVPEPADLPAVPIEVPDPPDTSFARQGESVEGGAHWAEAWQNWLGSSSQAALSEFEE